MQVWKDESLVSESLPILLPVIEPAKVQFSPLQPEPWVDEQDLSGTIAKPQTEEMAC